jgi:hypothetical protein
MSLFWKLPVFARLLGEKYANQYLSSKDKSLLKHRTIMFGGNHANQ